MYSDLNPYSAQLILYQIMLALESLHSRGIMHRDIKPLNIIVNEKTQEAKLIDFGLAEYYLPG